MALSENDNFGLLNGKVKKGSLDFLFHGELTHFGYSFAALLELGMGVCPTIVLLLL
jgi:hypothetical protein